MRIEGDAAQFAVIFGELDGDDDNVVLRNAVGCQPGGQELEVAIDSLHLRRPLLAADTNRLRDANALALAAPSDLPIRAMRWV